MIETRNFIDFLIQKNWVLGKPTLERNQIDLPKIAKGKLNAIDTSFLDFINSFKTLSNEADECWFCSLDDYSNEQPNAQEFAWNDFELESLEYAEDEDKNEIITFWGNHLPFLLSVKNGYAYAAIILKGDDKGKIVYGREPEYEDVEIISNSFQEFKELYLSLLNGQTESAFLSDLT